MNPEPIITAEKVPPNTITNAGIRNKDLKEPPSIRKAPKIDRTPRKRPAVLPEYFFKDNLAMILEVLMMKL